MLHDARRLEAGTRLAHDLCIVGAGAAGIALAREFLGSSTRVCVLESGGLAFDRAAQELADGENAGQRYFPIGETRLRRFGGTTGWWSGECRPLDPEEDLAPRTWLGHGGWPPTAAAELVARYERAARSSRRRRGSTSEGRPRCRSTRAGSRPGSSSTARRPTSRGRTAAISSGRPTSTSS
jgi:glycine/D-amino acid oxidase-like deaminating enzyme